MTLTNYVIVCDSPTCRRTVGTFAATLRYARRWLVRSSGWRQVGDEFLCPRCAA